jgi:hypothetical protein
MSSVVDIGHDGTLQEPIHGHAVVTTTSSALAVSGINPGRITRGILIRAPGPNDVGGGNTAVVFLGGSQVTADSNVGTGGVPLPPGASLIVPCRDPSKIFVIAVSGTQDVSWLGV